jgi:hypothetical protein
MVDPAKAGGISQKFSAVVLATKVISPPG